MQYHSDLYFISNWTNVHAQYCTVMADIIDQSVTYYKTILINIDLFRLFMTKYYMKSFSSCNALMNTDLVELPHIEAKIIC